MSPACALCCAGPRAAASDDAGREQRDGSIFSREGEKVFSHLADTASKRERLHRFCCGIERVLPQAGGRLAAHAETGGRAAALTRRGGGRGSSGTCAQGRAATVSRRSRASSPMKCTAFALVAGAGYPQRPAAGGRSPVDCTAFRVSSGGGLSTTHRPAHPADRGAHHSNPQGCESIRRPDIHTRLPASRRCGGDAHRSNAQDCESIERGRLSAAVCGSRCSIYCRRGRRGSV